METRSLLLHWSGEARAHVGVGVEEIVDVENVVPVLVDGDASEEAPLSRCVSGRHLPVAHAHVLNVRKGNHLPWRSNETSGNVVRIARVHGAIVSGPLADFVRCGEAQELVHAELGT